MEETLDCCQRRPPPEKGQKLYPFITVYPHHTNHRTKIILWVERAPSHRSDSVDGEENIPYGNLAENIDDSKFIPSMTPRKMDYLMPVVKTGDIVYESFFAHPPLAVTRIT